MASLLRLLPVTVLGCLLSGCAWPQANCEPWYKKPDLAALQADLEAAALRWKQADIQNYRYTTHFAASGEVAGQQTVTVKGGKEVGEGQTVDEQLDEVGQTLAEAAVSKACIMLRAEYDPVDGHVVNYEYQNAEKGLMDAFGGYKVLDFQRY